jgi:hypothetical protein
MVDRRAMDLVELELDEEQPGGELRLLLTLNPGLDLRLDR